MENGCGEVVFPNLSKLAECVMIMPHSNADSERIFSIVTDVKTAKRNRLGVESLNAVCVVRSSFRNKNVNSATFEVRKEHLDKHDTSKYKRGT